MEKVIRIRQALEKGYSLEKAAQVVARDLAALQAEVKRLEALANEDLEDELRRRFEKLEERVSQLRRTLPASLTIARLRRAVTLLARLEAEGTLQNASASGDVAKALALRLGRAGDELQLLLREGPPRGASRSSRGCFASRDRRRCRPAPPRGAPDPRPRWPRAPRAGHPCDRSRRDRSPCRRARSRLGLRLGDERQDDDDPDDLRHRPSRGVATGAQPLGLEPRPRDRRGARRRRDLGRPAARRRGRLRGRRGV